MIKPAPDHGSCAENAQPRTRMQRVFVCMFKGVSQWEFCVPATVRYPCAPKDSTAAKNSSNDNKNKIKESATATTRIRCSLPLSPASSAPRALDHRKPTGLPFVGVPGDRKMCPQSAGEVARASDGFCFFTLCTTCMHFRRRFLFFRAVHHMHALSAPTAQTTLGGNRCRATKCDFSEQRRLGWGVSK